MNPNTKRILRKFVATLVVVVDLQQQVAMAGAPVWMGLPPGIAPLASQTLHFAKNLKQILPASALWFNAFPYANLLDPRGQTDLPQQGQSTPESVVKNEERQMSVLRQMEELQIFQEQTFANRPKLPGSQANILDTVTTFKLNINVAKELRRVQEDLKKSVDETDKEMQSMRKAISGAGGSTKVQDDGSRMYSLHGLVVAIRGQRFLDGNGQITTVDTRRIKYDPKTRLQTASTRISKDSRGNVTVTVRENLKYSADSSEHGKQITEEYKETILDPNGNLSTVHRSNIKYLEGPDIKKIKGEEKRGQYVISYDEERVDQFGNRTTSAMRDGQYQRFGDNWYQTAYKQIETDADGNVTTIERKQTSYAFNTNYRKLTSIRTSRQEYMSNGYLQVTTDPKGQVKTEIRSGVVYDNRDNLTAYNEILQGADATLNTEVQFRNGKFDVYGQQTGFDKIERYADGSAIHTRRLNATFYKNGDVSGYDEVVDAAGGYLVHTIRSGIVYNRKKQQVEYHDLKVDQTGRFINVTWKAWQNGFNQDAAVDPSTAGWDGTQLNLG